MITSGGVVKTAYRDGENMNIIEYIDLISRYGREEYFNQYGAIEEVLKNLEQVLENFAEEQKNEVLEELIEKLIGKPEWVKIHLQSFCAKVGRNSKYTEELLETVLRADDDAVGEYNKLSHYWQINTASFSDSQLKSENVELLLAKLYYKLFCAFACAVDVHGRQYIPVWERNKEKVFVFTSQVLELEHAPTKTLLDRCYILQKYLHKDVTIINTAMEVPQKGAAPFYELRSAVYLPELTERTALEFKGETFKFHQCSDEMPNLNEIMYIIDMVKEQKPYYMVDIGGSDICADICGMFVPQITISTVFSGTAISCGEYQIIDKELTEHDKKILDVLNVDPSCVKKARFTFSFKEQEHTYTRKELGLPEEKFILFVVGARLDEEVDTEFLKTLECVLTQQEEIGVAFVGCFEAYEERIAGFSALKRQSYNLGFQTDILAVIECLDLYVNPKRHGGGSSVAEALYKGVPAVTMPIGDVAVAAGTEFCVPDYNAMKEKILEYAENKEFYRTMSCIAKNRAEELMDSYSGFGKMMEELEAEIER